MSNSASNKASSSVGTNRPALTDEARERRIISKAMDMAEEMIDNRTATSQLLVHYLKLGTVTAQLEQEKIKRENLLLEAKVKATEKSTANTELFEEALKAFRGYVSTSSIEDDDYEDLY